MSIVLSIEHYFPLSLSPELEHWISAFRFSCEAKLDLGHIEWHWRSNISTSGLGEIEFKTPKMTKSPNQIQFETEELEKTGCTTNKMAWKVEYI